MGKQNSNQREECKLILFKKRSFIIIEENTANMYHICNGAQKGWNAKESRDQNQVL